MEFILYLLKVNIALVLFYGVYHILFQQDTFFQGRRLALWTIICISFLYPTIDFTRQLIVRQPLKDILEAAHISVYSLPEIIITENTNAPVNFLPQALLVIYILVSVLLLVRLLFQIGAVRVKLRHADKKVLFGQTVYESFGIETPFSFFHWIVLDFSRYSPTELQEILLHETAHVQQKHSMDMVGAEFMCILCWFNPFAWLLKTEIRMNLEFLADRSVLSSGCEAEHYQLHLLRLSYPKAAAKITNNFNVSLLKKRIFMMNKKQTSHRSRWKFALILPVVAMLLFFNSTFQTKAMPTHEMNSQPNLSTAQDEPIVKDSVQIYSLVDIRPQFPGGDVALMNWLAENIVYPKESAEKGVQGRVILQFVVNPDGSIGDIEVLKSLDPLCDNEGIRVVSVMPKWTPGELDGKPVSVYFMLPIMFQLQPVEKPAK
ncbi:MAG: M56 family metallopeptidase [Candidatus Azobacteroides sp.]|nr:M56 family metallopeptidase [Candidatus Azobacteroides sp.]